MKLDPSAVIWSAPERERGGRPLIVLLHGYGSHEGDLFQLSPRLPFEPVVASVRAPISESGGWAWFSLSAQTVGNPSAADADAAASALIDWLDTLDYTTVSLLGFSQGAVVALQAMRLEPSRFSSIVALSGFVAGGESAVGVAGDAALETLRPPVFWGRGTEDPIIPPTAILRTDAWLPSHSTATIRIYEQLAHAVSSNELSDISAFMREHP